MSWSFETDPGFQDELDWIDRFVRDEVEPPEHVLDCPWDIHDPRFTRLARPLQRQVRERKLWACHPGPELGGPGYGQVKLALMNEILGRATFGPVVFGCEAPDSGNAEILATPSASRWRATRPSSSRWSNCTRSARRCARCRTRRRA
jgi:acyl-CoA dehydrogenase